jgi:alpha-D-xyloside xylohydrolase
MGVLSFWDTSAQIDNYEKQTDGVKFFVPGGEMKVRICTDEIIQVRYTLRRNEVPASDTIIVNRKWIPIAYSASNN